MVASRHAEPNNGMQRVFYRQKLVRTADTGRSADTEPTAKGGTDVNGTGLQRNGK